MPHTGLEPRLRFYLPLAAYAVLEHIFAGKLPYSAQKQAISARNQRIRELHTAGELGSDLAAAFGVSAQRISQIIRGQA